MDLPAAFADSRVDGVLTVLGGTTATSCPYVDFDLIAANPKVYCDHSDFTALHTALCCHTGVATYYGPHWSSFGIRDLGERIPTSFSRPPSRPSTRWALPLSLWRLVCRR